MPSYFARMFRFKKPSHEAQRAIQGGLLVLPRVFDARHSSGRRSTPHLFFYVFSLPESCERQKACLRERLPKTLMNCLQFFVNTTAKPDSVCSYQSLCIDIALALSCKYIHLHSVAGNRPTITVYLLFKCVFLIQQRLYESIQCFINSRRCERKGTQMKQLTLNPPKV